MPPLGGWPLAAGIDPGFIALELAQLAVGDRVRRQIARYARRARVVQAEVERERERRSASDWPSTPSRRELN